MWLLIESVSPEQIVVSSFLSPGGSGSDPVSFQMTALPHIPECGMWVHPLRVEALFPIALWMSPR